jgi:hypothetical protein
VNYAALRQQIAQRLYNRTDLDQVIVDYSGQVCQSYLDSIFYPSDVQDTSITTNPGQFLYNFPQNIRQVNRVRILLSSVNAAGASVSGSGLFGAPQTILSAPVTLPSAAIPVVNASGFLSVGTLVIGGNQIVNYTGISGNTFTGAAGGVGTFGSGAIVTQVASATTLTADTSVPASNSLPVVSTTGFPQSGTLFCQGLIVTYAGITATSFTGISIQQGGGGSLFPLNMPIQTVLANGAIVQLASGVWITMRKMSYRDLLLIDDLQPPVTTIPSRWAPFNNQFRLYPAPGAPFTVEITGNGAPPVPFADTDDNFWTEDAALLIIAGTTAEIMENYLGGEMVQDAQSHRKREDREYKRLLKVSLRLGGPHVVEPHGWYLHR